MSKYKCDKCGQESEMIPKEHGNFVNVFNTNNEQVGHSACSGTFVLVGVSE